MNIDDLMNTTVCKLARKQMIRKNMVEKTVMPSGKVFYEFDPLEVILVGYEILNQANKRKIEL